VFTGSEYINRFVVLFFCQGGRPSPFDRNLGTKMGAKCAEKLIQQIQDSVSSDGEIICYMHISIRNCCYSYVR